MKKNRGGYMELLIFFIIAIVTVLAIILIVVVNTYNKFQFSMIKISEAENNIDILLEKKLDYIARFIPIIKDNSKEDCRELDKVNLLKSKKLNNFELNQQLDKYKKELHEILDTDETLSKVEIVTTLYAEFEDNEEELEASKDYYNDNVTIYNKLVHCFPSNLIAILFHYKHKDFYIDEKEEMFEILKDDKR